jgi:uncharacterized membrane protein
MNVVLWILQALLAAAFVISGGVKLTRPKEKLAGPMPWSRTWPPGGIKALGAAEVLGGVGVVLPRAVGIATVLTPIAAVGLAVVMVGALVTHARLRDHAGLAAPAVLLIASVVVAAGRF